MLSRCVLQGHLPHLGPLGVTEGLTLERLNLVLIGPHRTAYEGRDEGVLTERSPPFFFTKSSKAPLGEVNG